MTHEPESIDALVSTRLNRRSVMRGAASLGLSVPAIGAAMAARPERVVAQEKVKVRLATWAGVDEAKELQAVVDEVNQAATTFEIVSEPSPADYYTKLQTTLAGGNAADLFWLSQEYVAGYADKGALLDISDRLAGDAESPAAKLDDYFPSVLQTAQYDGKTYGLPWISQPVVLYYNPALFDAAGVTPPDESWTWETFKEAAAALTDSAAGVYGTTFSGWPPLQMFIWQAGGEVISEDLTSSPLDSPEAIQAAEFYASIIYNEEYAPSEATIKEQGFGEMAKAGKVAMFFGGAGDDLDYAHTKDPKNAEMKVALVPKGPQNRANFAYTASTVISADTENADAAYQALVALSDGIHHWKVVAPRQSLANVDTIVASVPDKAESAPVILEALPDMRAFRVIPDQQEWDTVFFEQFQDPLFHGEGTAEELAQEVRPELEELMPT
ncbi:MAG: sugar ABC transporter substrate-binding protein [Chloroflexota bacterium]|nr:sugar ABC transporter substrate-binding protein [Chloroflexota bacterium]